MLAKMIKVKRIWKLPVSATGLKQNKTTTKKGNCDFISHFMLLELRDINSEFRLFSSQLSLHKDPPQILFSHNEKYIMEQRGNGQRATLGMKQSLSFQTLSFCKKFKQ